MSTRLESKWDWAQLFCALTMVVAAYLSLMEYAHLSYGVGSGSGLCASGSDSAFDCAKVSLSQYGTFLSIPLSVFGLAAAMWFLCLSMFVFINNSSLFLRKATLHSGLVVGLGSFYLIVLQVGVIQKFCTLCLLYDVPALLLLGAAFMNFKKARTVTESVESRQKARTGVMVSLGLGIVCFALSFYYLHQKKTMAGTEMETLRMEWMAQPNATIPANDFDSFISASEGARVEVSVFSDFMCPHCAMVAPELDKLAQKYAGIVSIRFKHYPLDTACNPGVSRQVHDGACLRAAAAQCATKQKKFKQLHDQLFERQSDDWRRSDFEKFASEAKIDVKEFMACLDRPETEREVRMNLLEGSALGIQGTPSIFVNHKRFPFNPQFTQLDAVVKLELEQVKAGP